MGNLMQQCNKPHWNIYILQDMLVMHRMSQSPGLRSDVILLGHWTSGCNQNLFLVTSVAFLRPTEAAGSLRRLQKAPWRCFNSTSCFHQKNIPSHDQELKWSFWFLTNLNWNSKLFHSSILHRCHRLYDNFIVNRKGCILLHWVKCYF